MIWLVLEILLFIAILIPTIIAMVTGAPWVPTPKARVERMLELAKLKAGDSIFDLGCGDGRMVQLASKIYRADATGFELSPLVYAWARLRNFFLRSRAKIFFRDFRRVDFSKANVIVCYLLPEILKKMSGKFAAELRPGAKIISYAFEISDWKPVFVEPRNRERNFGRIFVYELPISAKK